MTPPSPDWSKRELLRAVQTDDTSAILRVVEFGYSLDTVLLDGDSALHMAAGQNKRVACQALLNNKASVNLREEKNGFTALHYAAGEGHPEIVQLLLDNGADVGAKDHRGDLPAAWAKENCKALLEQRGGRHISFAEEGGGSPNEGTTRDANSEQARRELQLAASLRMERRRVELVETEDEVSRNLQRLALVLKAMQGFPPWSTSETVSKPLADTRQAVDGVYKVHVHVRWLAAESLGSIDGICNLFPPPIITQLTLWHSQYEASACSLSEILRQKPAPALPAGIAAEQVLDLLARPTQRLMRYQLFLDGMVEDASKIAGLPTLVPGLRAVQQAAKDMVQAVNEGKREREVVQQYERIVSQVVGVPEGVTLWRRNRRLLLEQDHFMQRDKQGYRKLVVLSDAVLVVKQGMQRTPTHAAAQLELRFKDMISLRGFTAASCPTVTPPYIDSAQAAMRERSFSFELWGRTFLGSEAAITRVVDAIRSAVAAAVPRPISLGALGPSARKQLGVGQLIGRDADGKPLVLYAF